MSVPPTGLIARTFAVLEAVAERGSSTARDIADHTAIPLPTVYRLVNELIRAGYLIHLRDESRYALGYRIHKLGMSLHEDIGVPPAARREVRALREDASMATYLAIHRGPDFVVVCVSDGPECPRLEPMGFGFHDTPHATAFGKLGLSDLTASGREHYALHGELRRLTPQTITDPEMLLRELSVVAERGIAWEHGEFRTGVDCLAVPVRAGDGMLIGSVAVSAPSCRYLGRYRHLEDRVRTCASRISRVYRLGGHHPAG